MSQGNPNEGKVSQEVFLQTWEKLGSAQAVAMELGVSVRSVYSRRRRIEAVLGRKLISEIEVGAKPRVLMPENKFRANMDLPNGTVLIGSDCHYMPDSISPAHRGFVGVAKRYKPDVVLLNGDIFDFASISRHPKLNTRPMPTLKAELDAGQARCTEIEKASPGSLFYRTLGNHDARLEVRIANNCPEFAGLVTLEDYLPRWKSSVSLQINGDTMVLHKWAQGMHAAYNNVMKGLFFNVITGHTHRLNCRPMSSSWRGGETRYGIETGTLGDPEHECFHYTLDTNTDWQPGFVMLTFRDGQMLYPEFAHVVDGVTVFRGEEFC